MKYLKIIFIIIIFIGLNGCTNFRDAVTGQKKKTTDEFLIKKKDPLILPPDYDNLPIPKSKKNLREIIVLRPKDIFGPIVYKVAKSPEPSAFIEIKLFM